MVQMDYIHDYDSAFIILCYGYRLDLFSTFQFHASLISVFYILSTYRSICEFGIALDMLQVITDILGSGCRAGWID